MAIPAALLLPIHDTTNARVRPGVISPTASGPIAGTAASTYRTILWDDFARADGLIDGETAPTGQAWNDIGNTELPGIIPGRIIDGALNCDRSEVGVLTDARNYTEIILDDVPDMVGAQIAFTGTTGSNNACVLLIADPEVEQSVSGYRNAMVHLVFAKGSFQVDVTTDGSDSLVTLGSWAWSTAVPLDGTPLSVLIERSGDTLTITEPYGTSPRTLSDPLISTLWGRSVTCESFYNALQDIDVAFHAVWAGVADTADPLVVDGAATNYHTNPSAEQAGTSGYAASGSSTISQSTDWNSPNDPESTHSIKVVTGNVAGQSGVNCVSLTGLAIAAGDNAFSAAVDLKATEALPMVAVLTVTYASGGGTKLSTFSFTSTVGEQTIRVGPVIADPTKIIDQLSLAVRCTQANTVTTFYVDAVNLRRAHKTLDHVAGNRGSGYSWAGTANLSASLRTASTLKYAAPAALDQETGSLLIRFTSLYPSFDPQTLLDIGDGAAGSDRVRLVINADRELELIWTSDGAESTTLTLTEQTIPLYVPLTVYASWDGTDVALNLYGTTDVTGSRNAAQGSWGAHGSVTVGTNRSGGVPSNALIHDLYMANRALTDAELDGVIDRETAWAFGMVGFDAISATITERPPRVTATITERT